MTKLDYARLLAGCLTYLVHRQRDRVGLIAFDSEIVEQVPPSAKHMEVVLPIPRSVDTVASQGRCVNRCTRWRSISDGGAAAANPDLYEEPDAVVEAIGPLRFRGNDIDRVSRAGRSGT